MLTLFDIIEQAQGGTAKNNLASQFGLSQEQTEQALAALMPAFSASLKQNTRQPQDLASFLGALGSGRHAEFYEDQMAAFTRGQEEGKDILGHMFGSKDASRAVAAQASRATGIGQEILKQMLPVIASMVMGGLFKQSTGHSAGEATGGGSSTAPDNAGGGILGQIMGEMMKGGLGGAMGGGAGGKAGNNPFGDILGQMMGGMLGGGSRAAPEPDSRQPEPRVPKGEDIFGQMFEAGREVQDGYARGMEEIVSGYLRGMDRHR